MGYRNVNQSLCRQILSSRGFKTRKQNEAIAGMRRKVKLSFMRRGVVFVWKKMKMIVEEIVSGNVAIEQKLFFIHIHFNSSEIKYTFSTNPVIQ